MLLYGTFVSVLLFDTKMPDVFNPRPFVRYRAHVVIRLSIAGWEDEIEFTEYFVCAFALRSLYGCCSIAMYLPRPFMRVEKLEFSVDNRDPITEQEYLHRCRNYEAVRLKLLKEVLFICTINHYYFHEKAEKLVIR